MKRTALSAALICILICPVTLHCTAQSRASLFTPIPTKEEAAEFLKRPLILCKREVDEKEAEKLKKKDPGQLKAMEAYNSYFNETMKFYFDSLYKGSKNIELKSVAEVDTLISSATQDVAIIIPSSFKRILDLNGRPRFFDTFTFELILPDKKDSNDIFMFSYMSDLLSDADFVFAVQQININLEKIVKGELLPSYDSCNKNLAGKLKNLKLIVNLQKLKEGLTKEEIKKNYTLPVEFVDSLSQYEDIITKQQQGYAYITSIWSPGLLGAGYVAVDAATGEILSVLSAGGVHFAIAVFPPKTGNFVEDKIDKRKYAFDVINFKVKYSLKAGHFEHFAMFASQSN